MNDTSSAIAFGIDGWRGVMGETFTEDNVRRVAAAFVRWLSEKKQLQQRRLLQLVMTEGKIHAILQNCFPAC